jgi:glyoxylase-like metal-dependent hydrolase (beta-lactamase superfamily II)
VLVYVFETPQGAVLIDAGWDTPEAWTHLEDGLATAGFGVGDVRGVMVTHIHPDHYGLSGRIREKSGAWVALHPADAQLLLSRYVDVDSLLGSMRALLIDSGVPDADVGDLNTASMGIRQFVTFAQPDVLLEDGDAVEVPGWDVRAIWTPGHSPGHLCFYEREHRILFSGDHVLPRISPNIAIHSQQTGNPLAEFLDALAKVAALDVAEVMPAHEWRFRGLAERAASLAAHHAARCDEIEVLLEAGPLTGWEVTTRLTWSRPFAEIVGFMRRAALGEALAHLVLLSAQQRVREVPGTPRRWTRA